MASKWTIIGLLVAAIILCVGALDNGLGRTPPMGYNTWYDVQCSDMMNEQTVRATADAIIKRGWHKLGYTYVNLDDCWAGARTAQGQITADSKAFPSGIKSLASYMHARGLKFGLYTDRGNLTCAGRPGSMNHTTIDARTYAEWGVDFVKEDSCHATQLHNLAFAEYAEMRDALNATGRPMFFDLCGWYGWYAPLGWSLGNEWRIGPDTTTWPDIIENINIDASLSLFARPGGWNNPCLLIGKSYNGNLQISELQSRAQFSMWAILSAPLMLSMDLRSMTPYAEETYSNAEVIAVDQDPLGKQGVRIMGGNLSLSSTSPAFTTNVWARKLQNNAYALIFINVGPNSATVSCDSACFARIGYTDSKTLLIVYDYWQHKDIGSIFVSHGFTTVLPALGGFQMIRVARP